jgi:hypothetical protein
MGLSKSASALNAKNVRNIFKTLQEQQQNNIFGGKMAFLFKMLVVFANEPNVAITSGFFRHFLGEIKSKHLSLNVSMLLYVDKESIFILCRMNLKATNA